MSKPTFHIAESVEQAFLCDCRGGALLDHFILRSSLPALPDDIQGPFVATGSIVGDKHSMIFIAINSEEATFLAALLNTCYSNNQSVGSGERSSTS